MSSRWSQYRRRFAVPALVLGFFGIVLLLFRDVLLPFIMACVIVFLMEPLVRRLIGVKIAGRPIPRWAGVISVYVVFLGIVSIGLLLIVPPLTLQVGKAAEEIPGYFNELREKYLPEWSRQIESLLGMDQAGGVDPQEVREAVDEARSQVGLAVDAALSVQDIDQVPVVDTSGAQPLLLVGEDRQPAPPPGARTVTVNGITTTVDGPGALDRSRVAFTIVRDPETNGFAFVMGEADLRVVPQEDGSYLVKVEKAGKGEGHGGRFSLEREIVQGLSGMVESGSEYAGDLLSLVQLLLEVIINAFVMIILTFMVAAFISIDLPRIMGFMRSSLPSDMHGGYDELLERLNKGLSGVIRGQLVICLINGVLTGVGLWALGVDFALILGIIAGVLSLIPVFGTIISTIPAVLMGMIESFSTGLLVLGWIMVVHFFDANFFTPKIVGSSSEMHPVVIIFALLAGQSAFGLIGALLAVPVASIVQTIFLFSLDRARAAGEQQSEPPAQSPAAGP